MHLKRVSQIIIGIGLLTLAQCGKNETGVSSAADKVESAVAKVSGNSIPVVTEGLSPAFRAVTSHLDVGGCAFSYNEATGAATWASMLDGFIKMAPEADRKGLPADFSFAKIFDMLGLNSLAAVGTSSRQRADGSYHSRAIAYMPDGRKGVMTLTGGPASKLLLLDVAPKDTDFGLELSLNLKDFTRDTLPKIMAMMPANERAKADAEMSQPVPGVGLTTKQILEKLDIRLGLFAKMDPSEKYTIKPGTPPIPRTDGVLVIDHLGWLIDALKPQFMPMLQNPQMPITVTDEAGVLTIRAKSPVGPPPFDFQPVVRYDPKADRVLVATRPPIFDTTLAGIDKFSQRADYAETWRDLPTEGNDCVFISTRYLQLVGDYLSTSAKTSGGTDAAVADQFLQWMKPLLSRNQTLVLANQPDGILTTSNLSIAVNPSTLSMISAIGVMASIAIPSVASINEKAKEATEIRHARELALALKTYASGHGGKYPEQLSDLVAAGTVSDVGVLTTTDPTTKIPAPWIYDPKLTDSSPAGSLLLVSPSPIKEGKRIAAYNDGSVKLITEAEYSVSKAKW